MPAAWGSAWLGEHTSVPVVWGRRLRRWLACTLGTPNDEAPC